MSMQSMYKERSLYQGMCACACARVQACKQADGYQPSLVAPEKGMRQLASEALDHVEDPVNTTVQEVYNLLVNAGRCGGWIDGVPLLGHRTSWMMCMTSHCVVAWARP